MVLPMAGRRRDRAGIEMARKGCSRAEIARALGVHERTAQNYQRAARDDRQGRLDLPDPAD